MPAVHFTGTRYTGFDGATRVTFTQPGYYEMSTAKAAQLLADFPNEFTFVNEATATAVTNDTNPAAAESSEKAPSGDEPSATEPEPSPATQEPSKPAKKGK